MALALCAHPRPALRACEEERLRTHAPGTQRNETTALAPPSGLPGSPSPREKPMVVCVPPTVPFGTSSVPKRPRSHYLVTSRGYIAAGIAGGPFKGRSGCSGLPRHQGCSRAGSRAGALVRRRPWRLVCCLLSPPESLAVPTDRSNGGGGLLSPWDPCPSSTAPPVASFAGLRAALGC